MPLLTREQVEGRKAKAVAFLRNVLEDDDRAAEVERESPESYADRKRITISNPTTRKTQMATAGTTKAELQEQVDDYEQLVEDAAGKIDELLDPVLTREELVQGLKELEQLLTSDEEDDEEDDDIEEEDEEEE